MPVRKADGHRCNFQLVRARGLFCSLHVGHSSLYRHTPEASGKVRNHSPNQAGHAFARFGIKLSPTDSAAEDNELETETTMAPQLTMTQPAMAL